MKRFEVIAASQDHEALLANLLELYAYDFSEMLPLAIGEDGRFGYASLPLYWSEECRQAFLIRVEHSWAGLALVKRGSALLGNAAVWDMAEFFILRAHRRCGYGTEVAHEIWNRFPGPWEVRVRDANQGALRFWAAAISSFVGEATPPFATAIDGERWNVFSFISKRL